VFLQKTNKETHMKPGRKRTKFAAVVGIDWADEKHDVCIWDAEGESMERDILEHRPEVLHDWVRRLRGRYKGLPVAVGLEQSRGALAYLLMQYGFCTIFFTHSATVAKLREAWTPSGAKDDPDDAELVMELVRDSNHKLQAWRPDTPETRRLQLLCEQRRKFVNLRVKLTNRLRSVLKAYYPLACEVAGDKLHEGLALDFLSKWPTLQSLKRARPSTLRNFYTRHSSRYMKTIEKRIEAVADAEPVTEDAVILETHTMEVAGIVGQLKTLRKTIKEYDKTIGKLYTQHDEATLIASLPATGRVFGPRLIAALGTDRNRFGSAGELANFSGIAPVTERSGKSEWIHRRFKCPTFIKQSFHEWANETTKHSIWARAFYIQAKERGMGHHQAVRALAFKWIRIIYRCWKERVPYDEMHYLSILKKRSPQLWKTISEHPDAVRLNGPLESQFLG
jgi:transposase